MKIWSFVIKISACYGLQILLFGFNAQSQEVPLWECTDLSYGIEQIDSAQTLNLVGISGAQDRPLLVWIGGGAWSHVDKNVEMDLAREIAKKGVIVASVGHRLSAEVWRDTTRKTGVIHPAHVDDIADAIQWLYSNASKYGVDRRKIVIGGFSSGAHLAALVTTDKRYLQQRNLPHDIVKGVMAFSGTYDINDYYNTFFNGPRKELATLHVEAVFGNDHAKFEAASPVKFIDQLDVPLLLISDHSLYRYTKLFEERLLDKSKYQMEVIYVHQMNHGELWRSLASDKSQYRDRMIQFIQECTS